MADAIDELFDCFDERGTDNDDENKIKIESDPQITNRYLTLFLTYKIKNTLIISLCRVSDININKRKNDEDVKITPKRSKFENELNIDDIKYI